MEDYNISNLKITISETEDSLIMIWKGSSDSANPGDDLNPYFQDNVVNFQNKKLMIDFSELEYMNSSTVPPIIKLIGLLNSKNITTTIIYLKDSNWQRTSFKALESIVKSMNNIEVTGK